MAEPSHIAEQTPISRPLPLTPPDCDLRSFDWFPFYHKRLLKSSFWSRASDQACRISLDFWSRAYEQVPAASLPDDDHLLADWAGFGRRNVAAWLIVKHEVTEPWVMCCDGRWYHPTLSEVACKAWAERRIHLWKRECERYRKDNIKRKEKKLDPLEYPPKPPEDPFFDADGVYVFEKFPELSVGKGGLSSGRSPQSVALPKDGCGTSAGRPKIVGGNPPDLALRGKGKGTTPSGIPSQQEETSQFGGGTTSHAGAHTRGLTGTDGWDRADDLEALQ